LALENDNFSTPLYILFVFSKKEGNRMINVTQFSLKFALLTAILSIIASYSSPSKASLDSQEQNQIQWLTLNDREAIRIHTPGFDSPLAILIFEGNFYSTKSKLEEPIGMVKFPFKGKIESIGLPFEKSHPAFKKFQSAYPLEDLDTKFAHSYVIRSEDSAIIIMRFEFEGNFYDLYSQVRTPHRIDSVKLRIVKVGTKDFTLHVSLDSKDDSIRGLYEINLTKGHVLAAKELKSTKSALQILRETRLKAEEIAKEVKKFVFGQDPVVDRLVHHIFETQTNGMTKPKVLVAMGPSGVGKSYSAQLLAERVYQDKNFVFEISGNEYNAGTHSLDYIKLLGGAKGTSAGKDGVLINWVKETQGKGVLIINEGDKMHSDVWKRLMEFLEKGRLTDSAGKDVWGKEIVVIITSNRGANRLFPTSVDSWTQREIDERLRTVTQDELKGYYLQRDGLHDNSILPREIINRVDEFIAFGPLSREAALKIATSTADDLLKQFQERYRVEIIVDSNLIEHVALAEFKSSDDARQIRNEVKSLITEITRKSLETFTTLEEEDKIRVTLDQNKTSLIAKISFKDQVIEHPVKTLLNSNPLQNSFQRSLLMDLENRLKSQIFGQEANLHQIVQALIAYEVTPVKERPFTLGLFGPSGTGKTEIGKTIARAFYGEKAKATVLPMGNIASFSDFETLFGSAAKYQGGEIEREFERALRENPRGGVIILDEISNMGGNDPKLKEALFKKLYDLFEEGKYTSPRDSRVYDLKKYKFILTGNDGEKLFLGMTSDDLLLSTWKENNRPEIVRSLLREANLPNAFINRINTLLLMKPLLKDEVHQVAHKLFQVQLKALIEANPGLKITLADNILDKLTHAFYSADQGGRSVRKALDSGITGAMGMALMKSGVDTERLNGVTLHLDIRDNHVKKPYLPNTHPERVVNLVTQVIYENKVVFQETIDMTDIAEKQILLSSRDAKLTAYHEAGHAVANDPRLTGQRVSYITIRGGSTGTLNYHGYARYESVGSEGGNLDYEKTVAQIARLWAGRKAQELAGFAADTGWSDDLRNIRRIASEYLTTWGLDREFIALPVDKEGKPQSSGPLAERFIQKMDALISEGEALAEKRLKQNWRLVRAITAELLTKGNISQKRFVEIEQALARGNAIRSQETYSEYIERITNRKPAVILCSKLYQ
jgi:ATP-dependent Clp protease ATP-binding subunit ClpA